MDDATMRQRVTDARVGRLATVTPDGTPHVVPCCFVLSTATGPATATATATATAGMTGTGPAMGTTTDTAGPGDTAGTAVGSGSGTGRVATSGPAMGTGPAATTGAAMGTGPAGRGGTAVGTSSGTGPAATSGAAMGTGPAGRGGTASTGSRGAAGDVVYSAVDGKPKSTLALRRLANVRAHPATALLVDHYDDDWSALWWIRLDGTARVLEPAATGEHAEALDLLAAKYPQYRERRPPGAVLALDVDVWRSWAP